MPSRRKRKKQDRERSSMETDLVRPVQETQRNATDFTTETLLPTRGRHAPAGSSEGRLFGMPRTALIRIAVITSVIGVVVGTIICLQQIQLSKVRQDFDNLSINYNTLRTEHGKSLHRNRLTLLRHKREHRQSVSMFAQRVLVLSQESKNKQEDLESCHNSWRAYRTDAESKLSKLRQDYDNLSTNYKTLRIEHGKSLDRNRLTVLRHKRKHKTLVSMFAQRILVLSQKDRQKKEDLARCDNTSQTLKFLLDSLSTKHLSLQSAVLTFQRRQLKTAHVSLRQTSRMFLLTNQVLQGQKILTKCHAKLRNAELASEQYQTTLTDLNATYTDLESNWKKQQTQVSILRTKLLQEQSKRNRCYGMYARCRNAGSFFNTMAKARLKAEINFHQLVREKLIDCEVQNILHGSQANVQKHLQEKLLSCEIEHDSHGGEQKQLQEKLLSCEMQHDSHGKEQKQLQEKLLRCKMQRDERDKECTNFYEKVVTLNDTLLAELKIYQLNFAHKCRSELDKVKEKCRKELDRCWSNCENHSDQLAKRDIWGNTFNSVVDMVGKVFPVVKTVNTLYQAGRKLLGY